MKILKFISTVAVILSTATLFYLAVPKGAQAAGTEPCHAGSTANSCVVTITPSDQTNGTPTVDPENQHIYRNKNQTVEWKCPKAGCTFNVTFTETGKPFHDRVFDNSHAASGHITGPPAHYKYTVIVNGTQIKDPMIIVH